MKPAIATPLKLGTVSLALTLALPVFAAGGALPPPQQHHEHGITWVSGGIGTDESHALKAEAAHYPLSLVFSAGRNAEYLADVPVVIKDRAGKVVLNTVSGGPLMLVRLPAGKYEINAVNGSRSIERNARVAAHGDTQVAFHWPSA